MRWWNDLVAWVETIVPLPTLVVAMLVLATLVALLWYFFPAWVPRRLPRIRLPRFKRRTRRPKRKREKPAAAEPVITLPEDEQPAALEPVGALSAADRLAAEGRYAEAIRQRLRDTLRELIDRRLIPPQPGWTAAELATMAADQRPAVAWPLGGATELFSEIWYGDRPAERAHDEHMRTLTDRVRAAL